MRLRFYRVEESYTDRLRKISPRGVTENSSSHLNTYIGILFEINNNKYIAPLTSSSKKNKWHQQPINITDSRGNITNKLGTILFHNMIPVSDNSKTSFYSEVDLESYKQSDIRRYNLYLEQLAWINETENKETILHKAKETYSVHFDSTSPHHYFLNKVLNCKFSSLEQEMKNILNEIEDH